MRGGARVKSGPAPDPLAFRRDRPTDQGEWTDLPATGRAGAPPPWPLLDELAGEATLWERQWARPQAVMWERNGQELEVALFVRALVVSEGPRASAADRSLVQRKMGDLGLTAPGLRALRWRIVEMAAPAARQSRARVSTRDRLKVVDGGA